MTFHVPLALMFLYFMSEPGLYKEKLVLVIGPLPPIASLLQAKLNCSSGATWTSGWNHGKGSRPAQSNGSVMRAIISLSSGSHILKSNKR